MIRILQKEDKDLFISMVREFYTSEAVLHNIPERHILDTYDILISDSPYVKAFIIESEGKTAGYGLICLTYSNEAGGLVVWIEELFVGKEFRGHGLGSQFLKFIETEYAFKAKRLRLELTNKNKSAKRLYQSIGFIDLDYKQMILDLD